MQSLRRRFAAWAVTLSLLSGVWLPLGAAPNTVDPDGICGPVLILEHSVEHFEATHPRQDNGHCVLCHWWNTMASASACSAVDVSAPADTDLATAAGLTSGPETGSFCHASPRAPPAAL